jgi:protein-L-isoaspartate(D-aspartate) O-methyltransferase
MVIPAGITNSQQLLVVDKDAEGRLTSKEILPVRFSELEIEAAIASAH